MIHFLIGYFVGQVIVLFIIFAGYNWQESKTPTKEKALEKKAPYMDLDD
jgi:hypothetical protein